MKKHGESQPFAFGPYIAIAGIIALLYGADIVSWYLGMYV
jgi:leader peptidase (prepilin peptidase)/N-methyltransferase